MNKFNWLVIGLAAVVIATGWFAYERMTEDTYAGMSIVPEQTKDIPLYDGLKLTGHQYVLNGNHWKEIYDFYLQQLPVLGWKIIHKGSTLDDQDARNDGTGGFSSRWRKEGFDGELSIGANYNQTDDQTRVLFDKTPIYFSTTWIHEIPSRVCIHQDADVEKCEEIKDKATIEGIVNLINKSFDWKEEPAFTGKKSAIDLGTTHVNILYDSGKGIYFSSDKGTKWMKPEREFFELTNLSE